MTWAGVLALCLSFNISSQGAAVLVTWWANPETDITGYIVHHGTNPSSFTTITNVGNRTNFVIAGLTEGITNHVAVSAVNASGLESELSAPLPFNINARPQVTLPAQISAVKDAATVIPGIVITDVDSGSSNVTVMLSVNRGIVRITTTVPGGVTSSQVLGNGQASVLASAPIASLRTTFARTNGVTYTAQSVGADTLTVTATDNGNSGLGGSKTNVQQAPITVTGTGGGTVVDSWRMQYFSPNDLASPSLESTVWGDTADPDRDGRNNLQEYALGLNPVTREGSEAGIIFQTVSTNGNSYPQLIFTQRKDDPQLQYIPEVSSDKQAWSSGVGVVQLKSATNLDATLQLVTYQALAPITPGQALFMRLRIVRN